MSMRAHLSKPVLGAVMALLAACSNPVNVRADYDRSVDFSGYRTWAFYAPLAIDKAGYSSLNAERMKTAVQNEMQARGYAYSEQSPDLLVNINAYINERQDVISTPQLQFRTYYNYRYNSYVQSAFWTDRTDVYNYSEGTLNIDLVDALRKQLVWEGIAVGRMANTKPAQRDTRIDSTIGEIFAQYPHRAGGQ